MQASFGWKRKRQLFGDGAAVFNQEAEGTSCEEQEVDWLSAAKKRRAILLEDSQAKSKRLQHEGTVLAENQRYWEAIKYWNEAIELTPRSAVLHEMKGQVNSQRGTCSSNTALYWYSVHVWYHTGVVGVGGVISSSGGSRECGESRPHLVNSLADTGKGPDWNRGSGNGM